MEHICSPMNNNINTNTFSLDVEAANPQPSPLRKMIIVASIAVGIQFGWALQLSLLTPYVQLLGIPHKWAAYIWLCGPISGLIVQPVVGYYSDQCTSRFGRRRPFILSGSIVVSIAVFLIGYAADLGHLFGDDLTKKTRPRAVGFFVTGFWILDVANNMLQGPCRAFLGDLAAGDHRKTRTANSFYSFFMAIGNVLGYAAGSYGGLHHIFPFTTTKACDVFCANLKSCFFLSIFLLLLLTCIVLFCVNDRPITSKENEESRISGFGQLQGALKELKRPMWMLMLVTALNWIAWFPFFLFDTDWMGREVYGGYNVGEKAYNAGVREGALGLMLNSVVLGLISLAIEPLGRLVGSVKWLWGIVNLILAFCLAMTILITKVAMQEHHAGAAVKVATLIFFSILGIPLAITYSVPFALASIYSTTTGAGQGLSVGILNIAIVGAQILVSTISGPWDALFGGGNMPMFLVGAVAAAVSAVLVIVLLPSPKPVDLEEPSATTHFH